MLNNMERFTIIASTDNSDIGAISLRQFKWPWCDSESCSQSPQWQEVSLSSWWCPPRPSSAGQVSSSRRPSRQQVQELVHRFLPWRHHRSSAFSHQARLSLPRRAYLCLWARRWNRDRAFHQTSPSAPVCPRLDWHHRLASFPTHDRERHVHQDRRAFLKRSVSTCFING